jgi:hypothetical protein
VRIHQPQAFPEFGLKTIPSLSSSCTQITEQQHGCPSFWRTRQSLRAGSVSSNPMGITHFFAKLRYHPTGNNTCIPRSKCCLRKRFKLVLYSDSYLLEVMQQLMFVGLFTLVLLIFANLPTGFYQIDPRGMNASTPVTPLPTEAGTETTTQPASVSMIFMCILAMSLRSGVSVYRLPHALSLWTHT